MRKMELRVSKERDKEGAGRGEAGIENQTFIQEENSR